MKLTFFGAAGTVTGSRYLLDNGINKVLIDCGLFQGLKALRLKNWDVFPCDPRQIDGVFLTHAHLDHSGYLPKLVREGFKGTIYCSAATYELCRILLFDSAKLMEEQAQHANRHGYSKHKPAMPLYTSGDVEAALKLFTILNVNHEYEIFGFKVLFKRAGHILGASTIRFIGAGKTITFSGDVGRPNDSLIIPPEPLAPTDYLVLESTYGDRRHPIDDSAKDLENAIKLAHKNNGVLLIPAFAVGRAQEMLFAVSELKRLNRIPNMPIYIDSPMASDVSELYHQFPNDHRLSDRQFHRMYEGVSIVRSTDESKMLGEKTGSRIVISASGMATGGRVLYHLKACAENPANVILFAGYQAAGTRGANMVAGIDEIKIHGEYIKVRAKVFNLESFSAHADFEELISWIRASGITPKKILITHGEPAASDALRRHISENLGFECEIPELGQTVNLE